MADHSNDDSTSRPTYSSEPYLPSFNSAPNLSASPSPSAPLLRPLKLGAKPTSSRSVPKLGLSIPAKVPTPTPGAMSRPKLPALSLSTPMGGSYGASQPPMPSQPQPPRLMTGSFSTGSESSASQSRSGSFGPLDGGRASNPTSAESQYSFQSHLGGLGQSRQAPDPTTDFDKDAADAFDKLSLEKVQDMDVEELDEEGWKIVSREKMIVEISSLGEGAGGAVTKCKLKNGKTKFALKIITSNPDPDVRKQILRELKFNKRCCDAHICRYYGAFEDQSTSSLSIAMEFCEGGSLDSIYKEVKRLGGRTGEKVLGKIAEGVLKGLTYLHGQRIIHRDIKPSNILLTRGGDIKLCDFGVSGVFGTKEEADTFIGTSYYMAPERITGQPYTITSDVWSTGVTLLEVAQHRFPFPADGTEGQPQAGLIELLTYIVRQPIPRLKDEPENNITWSKNFKYFIECCLEKDPQRRGKPWRMMEHPWMKEMSTKRVNIRRFLAQVWGWESEEGNGS